MISSSVDPAREAGQPRSTVATNPKKLFDGLLIVRAFACAVVIVHHVFGSLPPASWDRTLTLGPLDLTFILNSCAQCGVYLFFCLSGYLMGKGFIRDRYSADLPGATAFFVNRFLRIVPTYLFFIATVIIIGNEVLPNTHDTLESLGRLLSFRYDGESGLTVMLGHLWSISTEVQFYLCVPFVMFVLTRIRRQPSRLAIVPIVLVMIAGLLAREAFWWSGNGSFSVWLGMYKPLSFNADLFMTGILLNYIPKATIVAESRTHVLRLLGGLGIAYVIFSAITHYALTLQMQSVLPLFVVGLPTIVAVVAAVAIWYCESMAWPMLDGRAEWTSFAKRLSFLGTLTYALYVWHAALATRVEGFVTLSSPLETFAVRLPIVALLAFAFALVTYYGLELPLENKRRSPARLNPLA